MKRGWKRPAVPRVEMNDRDCWNKNGEGGEKNVRAVACVPVKILGRKYKFRGDRPRKKNYWETQEMNFPFFNFFEFR